MKILIVNKYDNTGGAAIAAQRLYKALKKENITVDFLVQESSTEIANSTSNNFINSKINFIRFSLERLKILKHIAKKKNLFAFDSASFGEDITKNQKVINADIIHLHWINFGFISLKSFEKLLQMNKKIVWTFHDMWPFTGGCFYNNNCEKYTEDCDNCPFLKTNSKLAKKIFNKKKKIYNKSNFNIVALSNWMQESINKSFLLKNKPIINIGNPIDTDIFKPESKTTIRQKLQFEQNKIYLGFIAFNVNDERKGAEYLKQSLLELLKKRPELSEKIKLVAIGKIKEQTFFGDLPVEFTGYISDTKKMIEYYNAFDIMLLPSLEDNVPLVVQEAMSCETPLVAFNSGGIPDMIDHKKNGYLAKLKDTNDFRLGIIYCIENIELLKTNARKKMITEFSEKIIVKKYLDFYKSIIK